MDGQMTIFDILVPDINELPEEEMVKVIGQSVGLDFKRDEIYGYMAKVKKVRYTCEYDTYAIEPFTKFISVGYDYRHGGAGKPCDTIGEAIEFFKHAKERVKQ